MRLVWFTYNIRYFISHVGSYRVESSAHLLYMEGLFVKFHIIFGVKFLFVLGVVKYDVIVMGNGSTTEFYAMAPYG